MLFATTQMICLTDFMVKGSTVTTSDPTNVTIIVETKTLGGYVHRSIHLTSDYYNPTAFLTVDGDKKYFTNIDNRHCGFNP